MRRFLTFLVIALGLLPALAHAQPWPSQCPSGTPSGALGCFPRAVAPVNSDLIYGWQIGQSPHTRAFQVQQLFNPVPTSWTGNAGWTGQLILRNNDATVPWTQGTSSGLIIFNTMTGNYNNTNISFNRISASYGGQLTGASVVSALSVSLSPLSTYTGTEFFTMGVGLTVPLGTPLNTGSDLVALGPGVTVNDTTKSGGADGSRIYAISASTIMGAHGVVQIAHAVHVEQAIALGGQAAYRDAFSALAQGAVSATIFDAAYTVSCTAVSTNGCYQNLLGLVRDSPEGPRNVPLSPTASLIAFDITTPCDPMATPVCPMTMASGINLPNINFTTDYMRFRNWAVKANGHEFAGATYLNDSSPGPPLTAGSVGISAANTGNTGDNVHCYTGTGAAGCWELLIGTLPVTAWIPYYTTDPPGSITLKGTTPTVGAGQLGIGTTTVAAGSGTCPTGVVGGANVIGCLVVSVGSVLRNFPFF